MQFSVLYDVNLYDIFLIHYKKIQRLEKYLFIIVSSNFYLVR